MVERGTPIKAVTAVAVPRGAQARPITQLGGDSFAHWPSGIAEFDRVLGGGLVPGAAILLSGEPGVGKSTLLLEVAARAARRGTRVLYVSAEESAGAGAAARRTHRRARRRALPRRRDRPRDDPRSGRRGAARVAHGRLRADRVVGAVGWAAGQPAQVREVAGTLIRVAKERNLPVVLVGHVTKDGSIAGPRLLEHLVDVVCSFEGDRQTALRFVRALKNRFGPTDEVGCFEMTGDGIAEVPDPSGLFLSRGGEPVSGTCVTIAMEGRRALPVEVQALIVGTQAPQPRRVVNGVDSSRVAMLLAVLERRCGLKLSQADVYVSTVGGIRITEPAADLAIALAIASAMRDQPLPAAVAAIGEISLAGELRPVTGARQRVAEAKRLGYATVIDGEAGSVQNALKAAFTSVPPTTSVPPVTTARVREDVPAF